MILRVNGLILDFNEDVEIEKHSKIFEQIDLTTGDFSYSFSLAKTARNLKILGIPSVDIYQKPIYRNVNCDILDDSGVPVYRGSLRVERVTNNEIECSFFSGNYNWISQITGNVSDLDFSEYDLNITEANIIASRSATEGITFPIIDIGGLITRSKPHLKVEDFVGCIYVKTVLKKIFQNAGIKLKGELTNDFLYNNTVIGKNNKNKNEVESRSAYVNQSSTQTLTNDSPSIVQFQDDSTFPFFDGSQNNYSTSTYRYTADVKMSLEVKSSITMEDTLGYLAITIFKNGVIYWGNVSQGSDNVSISKIVPLEAGEYVDIRAEYVDTSPATSDIVSATANFTPKFIYKATGVSTVPNWTSQEFVANFFNLFNVVTDYDPVSKELTCDFFDRIKQKTPIDLSPYLQIQEVDYEELISNYGRKNYFTYDEGSDEELRDYNIDQFIKYGSGVIEIENDFIDEEADIIEVKFKTPISYINSVFDASIERVDIIELTEDAQTTFTGVANSSGLARFTIDDDFFVDGELVRVKDSSNSSYNGDYVIESVTTGFVVLKGLAYDGNASGTIVRLNYEYTDNDDVFIFVNIPNYSIANFSGLTEYTLENTNYTSFAYAYFNLLNTGQEVNEVFKQSLTFGAVQNPLFYQRTLLESYWSNFDNMLNDPVKLKAIGYVPKNVFLSLTPLNPVFIKTQESSNLYYLNKIFGYKNSYKACEIELIKL